MRLRHWKWIALLLAVMLVAAACGTSGSGDQTGTTGESETTEGSDAAGSGGRKVITIAAGAEPVTVLPTLTEGTWESLFEGQLFCAMVGLNHNYEVIPGVANSWEWDDETLTFTFHLRDDVYFHDGEQLTAEDVIWTLKYPMHPDYEGIRFDNYKNIVGAEEFRAGQADDVPGLSAPDDFTVKIQLKQRDATALMYIAGTGIMPKHYYEPYVQQHGIAALKGSEKDLPPVGCGPFKWKEWVPEQWIVLERFEDYYMEEPEVDGQAGKARVDEVRVVFIPDQDAQFQALQAGEVDFVSGLTPTQFKLAQNDPNLQAIRHPYLVYDQLMFNFRDPKFQDVRVRRAIGHGFDRQKLVDTVLEGLGTVAPGGHTHPIRWDYTDEFAQIHPNYDPAKTIELMEAAGWTIEKDENGKIKPGAVWTKNGEKFTFEIATNHPNQRRADAAQFIQFSLRELGFDVTLRVLDTNTFYDTFLEGNEWDTAIAGWRLGADPGGGFELIFGCHMTPPNGWNWMHYCSEGGVVGEKPGRLTELDNEGRLIMDDLERRKEIYREANRILVEDLPYIWLYYQDGLAAARKGLTGIEPVHPSSPTSDLWRWDWE